MKILGIGGDVKTIKGDKYGYVTGITYLAPSNESGVINTCTHASAGCRAACLFTAGRGSFHSVIRARVNKTLSYFNDTDSWMRQLIEEITSLNRKAVKLGKKPAVRLNGTSDLAWETVLIDGKNIMDHFPDVQFYDYTKNPHRMRSYLCGTFPKNYYLTFSQSEVNQEDVEDVIQMGGNVAVVFYKTLPEVHLGLPVINGDDSDLRFNDPVGCIVGLVNKGKAGKDCSGFVVK